MFAFLKRTIILLIGFLLVTLFIWFAGPYFAFAEFRPLESEFARLVAIGIVVGIWLLFRLMKRLKAYRASDRLLTAVVAQPQPQAEKARTPAEVVKLRERFEEAVSALKQQRRSGHSLYDLPWYVIIGAPGSGKTTALLNSGLRFPLEQRVGKGALRGVGGTRNCDWWFTDEAVFLDTAGRYTTQDSDATSDSVGWAEFLALLRKYRARRPLNGVIVTVSVQDLLMLDPAAREAHVEAARNRLAELNRELGIQLPVYAMVTKCDLVDGFAEYFEDLTAEARAQVWGITFPYDQTLANESPTVYPAEFDALMTRLNERVFDRLEEVRDIRRRAKVFAFPQQMAALRDSLTQWVSDVFSAREFDGRVLLRGVYFTSGTQEGTPIDRLLGTIGRTFGATDAVMSPRGPGKAFFVEHLLKQVMIGESGLAGVNRRLELRNASILLGAYAATGLITAFGVAALSISYARNREFLQQIDADITAFEQTPAVTPASALEAIVVRLDAIRAVVDRAEQYSQATSLPMRWGLHEGRSLYNSSRLAYVHELDSILLPRFAMQIQSRLGKYAVDPQKLYVYFKAYQMLGDPRHLDKDYLQRIADSEWKHAEGGAATAGPAIASHFKALMDNAPTLRQIALDPRLVGQARSSLPLTLVPRILYDDIKANNVDEPGQGLRIDQAAGLGAERVFSRRSGLPLSTPMPRLYTADQFKLITVKGRLDLLELLKKDLWIWGDSAASLSNAGALVSAVGDLYEADYVRTWDGFLDDLQFLSPRTITIGQLNEELRILTSPTSPLRGLLRVVADNTTLVEMSTSAPKGVVDETKVKLRNTLSGVLGPMEKAVGMASVAPGTSVTVTYQWVRQLMAGEPGKTQLDAIINSIAEIQKQIDALGPGVADKRPLEFLSNQSFRDQLQTLRQQGTGLPPAIGALVAQIVAAAEGTVVVVATGQVEDVYTQKIVPACNSMIANRYPFASAQAEVQLVDFGTVFGYDGLFDKFFTDYLEKHVDATGPVWTWRPGSVNPSHRLLDQIQQARHIRDMFFNPGSKIPEVKFFVTFSDLDPNAQRAVLTIDGSNVDDKRGKQGVTWPGTPPGTVRASFDARYFDPPRGFDGPWAWFRMIDAARIGNPDAQQRIGLNIQDSYHRVRVTVEPARATGNPFATGSWRQFSCES
jgi:type VI secretion system protein ImpL